MDASSNPQNKLKLIHITGTKGKGSTAIFLSKLLQSAGYKAGLFTSPHLVDLRERIQINQNPISKKSFVAVFNSLLPHINKIKPTFFEITAAMAFHYFAKKKVDYAVIEVGLGGRLDATNIIKPLVSVITRIDFDHMDILGNTITKIAREKAGIIKQSTPVITIPQPPEAMRIIRSYAKIKKAPLYVIPKSQIASQKLPPLVTGKHQKENFILALAACERLKISAKSIYFLLGSVILPARIETVSKNPLIIVDVSHNPVSIKALADTIKKEFEYDKLILILGLARDKEVDKILKTILPIADIIIFTKSDNPRLLEPIEFIDYIKDFDLYIPVFLEPDCRKTLRIARSLARKNDLILITGSFSLAGALYPTIKH